MTVGGEKSNHARITAAACARLGIKCVLVLNCSGKNADNIPASRYAYEMYGAEVEWVGSRDEREPTELLLTKELVENGERAAYLPLGLSIPIGAVGYVAAYREVMTQFDLLRIQPECIFLSSSSGGTQAGLVAGNRLFGNGTTKIVGVSPDDPASEIAAYVVEVANETFDELGSQNVSVSIDAVTVLDEYIGRGYGVATTESKETEALFARNEGILLDPLYTSKAAAAMIDCIRQDKFKPDDVLLFWHTGGQLANFYAPLVSETNHTDGK